MRVSTRLSPRTIDMTTPRDRTDQSIDRWIDAKKKPSQVISNHGSNNRRFRFITGAFSQLGLPVGVLKVVTGGGYWRWLLEHTDLIEVLVSMRLIDVCSPLAFSSRAFRVVVPCNTGFSLKASFLGDGPATSWISLQNRFQKPAT